MSNELIVQQLKDKEAQLLIELNKVRLALKAFIDDNINFGNQIQQNYFDTDLVPKVYDEKLTYGSKILFVLNKTGVPMLVDDIVNRILELEPAIEPSKLHKNISHNLSMLAKYSKVRKHAFNRRIKYSL